jgi:micrococcal nuclease
MLDSRKFRQTSTVISFVVVLIFSIFRVWQSTTDSRIKGEQIYEEFEKAYVERVVDGDTLVLEGGQRLRYIGIDTPETVHPHKDVECFGLEASEYNKQLVEGKLVYLESDIQDTDRYGRLLRYVWIDEEMVNEILVREGYAFASSFPPNVKYQEKFTLLQKEARESEIGLWKECDIYDVDEINIKINKANQSLIHSAMDKIELIFR